MGKPIIFTKKAYKEVFLGLLKMFSEKLRMRVFAYCTIDNHYHLIIENSLGRMLDFVSYMKIDSLGSLYKKIKERLRKN